MSIPRTRMSICLLAAWLALGSAALAAQSGKTASTPGTGQRTTGSVRFIDAPSGETAAAREKRLRRECRGRPNAGACLGMTR